MVSVLAKRISNLNILNCSKNFLPSTINVRGVITNNEEEWIKENSLKLIEQVKKEKGPDLNIDLKQPQLYFDKAEEFKNVDEVVKKILSLEYASRKDFKRYEEELVRRTFQRLPIDDDSLEIQIALHTLNIRRMCKNLEEFNGKNKRIKFFLYRQIHRRDRLMVQLFYKDNKRYEWLKEKLNLKDYVLQETYPYKRVTKYQKSINEVKAITREKRLAKLDQLKQEFEKQKELFFAERNKVLEEIQKEIKELGFNDFEFPKLKLSE